MLLDEGTRGAIDGLAENGFIDGKTIAIDKFNAQGDFCREFDRLIMVHRGKIIRDFHGAEKMRIRVDDLLARFEELRRAELLDESAVEMLRRACMFDLRMCGGTFAPVEPTRLSASAPRKSIS